MTPPPKPIPSGVAQDYASTIEMPANLTPGEFRRLLAIAFVEGSIFAIKTTTELIQPR